MRALPLGLALASLLLLSCGAETPDELETIPANGQEAFSSPQDTSSGTQIIETHNVTYTGIVRPAGISIYMEGSHKMELPDNRFILLESASVDLNGYVGEMAEVTGSLRPTVEEGGMIMRVEKIRLLAGSSSSVSSLSSSPPSSATLSSKASSAPSPAIPASSAAGQAKTPTSPASSAAKLSSASPVSSSEPEEEIERTETPTSPAFQARVTSMAKQNLSAENWTQQYCTEHIGFCMPVHRNWWYKSFGTTTSALWHVEVSSEEIQSIGDGPIVVSLVSGSVAAKHATDGQVRAQGSLIIAYREWSGNQHFEISAPSALENAVSYIAANLKANEVPQP
ncbi:MAG: hypothetical protein PHI23_00080 [Candidatus Peribacteraceae bacterium]|nr:hypothetical protein [Candidatus Peribacteraceae bacterium]